MTKISPGPIAISACPESSISLTVDADHPVVADRAGLAARHAERREDPVVREDRRGHRLAEADHAHDPVAAPVAARAAAAPANGEALDEHGEAPFHNFGIGDPGVGQVGVDRVGAVEVGPAPEPPQIVS